VGVFKAMIFKKRSGECRQILVHVGYGRGVIPALAAM